MESNPAGVGHQMDAADASLPVKEARRIARRAAREPIKSEHMCRGEFIEISHEPLGVIDLTEIPEILSTREGEGPFRQWSLIRRTSEDPIKHFDVHKTYTWKIPTGIAGKFWLNVPNPTPFRTDGEMHLRAVGDGFKFVDQTFTFLIARRAINHLVFKWSFGFWDMLARAFWSLFSSETTCEGWLRIGRFKRNFDITKEIPIKKR